MLTFDEPTHTYYWNGKPVPNVTRIIAPLTSYDQIPADVLANAQQEGKAIHKMVELDCNGTLDVAALPEWMKPCYDAWCEFREDSGFEPTLSEHRVFHPVLEYAGTLDLFGDVKRLKHPRASKPIAGPALIDVKRSFYAGPAIRLQTVAYADALGTDKAFPKAALRGALRLGKNGKYRFEPFEEPDDKQAFIALLVTHRWKEKHYGRS